MTPQRQRRTLDFLQKMNELDTLDGDSEMAARISSYELAFRMQIARRRRPWTLAKETEATRRLYGLDQKHTAEFGTRCLLARRLVERGVRFVQLYSGGGPVSRAVGRAQGPGGQPREDVRHDGPAGRRAAQGSEAARAARFHAGDLGRGVRAPADVAERRRPRPQSARLHDVVRGRRREGRAA